MFGQGHTYFADSPVVIDINGLYWGTTVTSPFTIVKVEVLYDGNVVGDFHADTGGQTSISFDISSALRAIWSDYDFNATDAEVSQAQAVTNISSAASQTATRNMREYSLHILTEYLASDDGGTFTVTDCGTFSGGQCLLGGYTEIERSEITQEENADVSHLEHTNIRYGDASTKPICSPERVGRDSITSWVDVQEGQTKSIFYSASYQGEPDDVIGSSQGWTGHAPLVLRDSQTYTDFLFVNRRGAVETCSALIKESMGIEADTKTYSKVERPTFNPARTLMAFSSGRRRSWSMSSGYQTREWAEWWTMEFLMARQWWMLYKGRYVPVTVTPSKKDIDIYDRQKQQMPHVDFTVTLALQG